MKDGVLIIECLDKDDPGSEGRLLKELFNLMQVASQRVRVASIDKLLEALADSAFRHVHISTHGSVTDDDEEKFRGLWTPKGVGTRHAVGRTPIKLACTSIVSTACKSGSKGFAKHVADQWGVKYYIAPAGSPFFYDAAFFALTYYYKLFINKLTVPKAFASFAQNHENPHSFTLSRRNTT